MTLMTTSMTTTRKSVTDICKETYKKLEVEAKVNTEVQMHLSIESEASGAFRREKRGDETVTNMVKWLALKSAHRQRGYQCQLKKMTETEIYVQTKEDMPTVIRTAVIKESRTMLRCQR